MVIAEVVGYANGKIVYHASFLYHVICLPSHFLLAVRIKNNPLQVMVKVHADSQSQSITGSSWKYNIGGGRRVKNILELFNKASKRRVKTEKPTRFERQRGRRKANSCQNENNRGFWTYFLRYI
eukprot:scaffold6764_cov169-Amphora_coffeaeformis.AAC.2